MADLSKSRKTIAAIVGAAVVLTLLVVLLTRRGSSQNGVDVSFHVTRGDLRIVLTENGEIIAKESVKITPKIKLSHHATIVWLIDEGSHVKKDDVLAELDKTDLEKQITEMEGQLLKAEADFVAAETNLEVQKMENESNVRKAQLKVDVQQMELDKYKEGEAPKNLRTATLTQTEAESRFKRAREKSGAMPALLEEGFVTRDQVEQAGLDLQAAQIKLETATLELNLLKKYTAPMDLRKKDSDLAEAKDELVRTKKKSESQLGQKEAAFQEKKNLLASLKRKYKEAKEEIEGYTVKSPDEGIVIYGDPDQWWRRNEVRVGGTAYNRSALFTLPVMTVMQVRVNVHEADVDKVKRDQPATVTCDVLPGVQMKGKVVKVASVPNTQNRWMSTGVKEFRVDIDLEGSEHSVRPNTSAKAEIFVEEVNDVLYVPSQAVRKKEGAYYCFLERRGDPEMREVTLGKSNDTHVVVASGLEEGDRVLLAPPVVYDTTEN